jgi:hypothetical protein
MWVVHHSHQSSEQYHYKLTLLFWDSGIIPIRMKHSRDRNVRTWFLDWESFKYRKKGRRKRIETSFYSLHNKTEILYSALSIHNLFQIHCDSMQALPHWSWYSFIADMNKLFQSCSMFSIWSPYEWHTTQRNHLIFSNFFNVSLNHVEKWFKWKLFI